MKLAGIFNDTSITGHYGCTAVMRTLVSELSARGIKPAYLWPVAVDWHGHVALLKKLEPDFIVVNGEGTIHDSAERQRTRDLVDVAYYAKSRGLPAHLINASITALDTAALDALRVFDSIYVRESESLAYLAKHNISAGVVPDLSLGLVPPQPAQERSGIIVTDSVLRETALGLRDFADSVGAHHERMKPRLSRIDRFYDKMAKKLRLSPEARRWRARGDADAFAQRLSESSLVVTGRFHSVLLSILTDTPFVALPSNTRKIEAVLMDVFGDKSRLINAQTLADPDFIAQARAGIPYSASERAALVRYRSQSKAKRGAMFDLIAKSGER